MSIPTVQLVIILESFALWLPLHSTVKDHTQPPHSARRKKSSAFPAAAPALLVEMIGIEPTASGLQSPRSPN